MRLYLLLSGISVMARMLLLPNPFECFGDNAMMINIFAEPIIQTVTYLMVGLVYTRGSNPALGSLLFLITYAVIVGLLWVLGLFEFATWWIIVVAVALVAILALIALITNKINEKSNRYDRWD